MTLKYRMNSNGFDINELFSFSSMSIEQQEYFDEPTRRIGQDE